MASIGVPSTLSVAVSAPPPSMLKGKTIEEIVNRWTSELDVHVREFNKFASEVAAWDRALMENSNTVRLIHFIVQKLSFHYAD
jgi:nuclear pore complex protein Nup62